MSRSHYELLDVPRTASRDEIKHAFRREIARYHPDKVQHLGPEFETVAAVRSAELTQAYTTLVDPVLREQYDALLGDEPVGGSPDVTDSAPVDAGPQREEDGCAGAFAADRVGASDFIRRAIASRFRQSVEGHFGRCGEVEVAGFDLACVPSRPALFGAAPPRILVRYVDDVDGEAVVDAWRLAVRMRTEIERDVCLFLLGPGVAPPGELAAAIQEQRRKRMPGGAKLSLVPVNTRTWQAHIPADAPSVVKALLALVKAA